MRKTNTFLACIVLIIVLSSTVLSVFAKENPKEGQPFKGILDAIDGMKESIAGQLDSLLDAITGSKQQIIGNITESQVEIQGSVSASEESIKDAILQAETEIVSNITDARDEISGKIDNIQYDGLVIKSGFAHRGYQRKGHSHCYFEIDFSKPSIVKAIYIEPISPASMNLHFYEASVVEKFGQYIWREYHLDVADYNPKPGEESFEPFEVLNKFDLHEIALLGPSSSGFSLDTVLRIFFEAGVEDKFGYLSFDMTIIYESTPDSVCDVDLHIQEDS